MLRGLRVTCLTVRQRSFSSAAVRSPRALMCSDQRIRGAGSSVQGGLGAAFGAAYGYVNADAGTDVALVGKRGKPVGGGFVQRGQHVDTGRSEVRGEPGSTSETLPLPITSSALTGAGVRRLAGRRTVSPESAL